MLVCEKSSSYMNKVKPFFLAELGAPKKRAEISKIRDKNIFFIMYLGLTKF